MVADKWNDPDFYIYSQKYSRLHREFVKEIDCSHINVVEMGALTPQKAKRKYMDMQVQVVLVRQNWLASGNGDGSRRVHAGDDDSDFSADTTSVELMDANDKANFLQGRSPSILYLWQRAEEYGILDNVCQQLSDACSFDLSDTNMLLLNLSGKQNSSKKGTKPPADDTDDTDNTDDTDDTRNLKIKMDTDKDAHVVDMCKKVSLNRGKLDELNEKIFDMEVKLLDETITQAVPCMN